MLAKVMEGEVPQCGNRVYGRHGIRQPRDHCRTAQRSRDGVCLDRARDGSPDSESGKYNTEDSQHEVTIMFLPGSV